MEKAQVALNVRPPPKHTPEQTELRLSFGQLQELASPQCLGALVQPMPGASSDSSVPKQPWIIPDRGTHGLVFITTRQNTNKEPRLLEETSRSPEKETATPEHAHRVVSVC